MLRVSVALYVLCQFLQLGIFRDILIFIDGLCCVVPRNKYVMEAFFFKSMWLLDAFFWQQYAIQLTYGNLPYPSPGFMATLASNEALRWRRLLRVYFLSVPVIGYTPTLIFASSLKVSFEKRWSLSRRFRTTALGAGKRHVFVCFVPSCRKCPGTELPLLLDCALVVPALLVPLFLLIFS